MMRCPGVSAALNVWRGQSRSTVQPLVPGVAPQAVSKKKQSQDLASTSLLSIIPGVVPVEDVPVEELCLRVGNQSPSAGSVPAVDGAADSATSNDNEASALLPGSVPAEDGAGDSAASNDNEASARLQGVPAALNMWRGQSRSTVQPLVPGVAPQAVSKKKQSKALASTSPLSIIPGLVPVEDVPVEELCLRVGNSPASGGVLRVETGQADADCAGDNGTSNDNEACASPPGVLRVETGQADADCAGDNGTSNDNEACASPPGSVPVEDGQSDADGAGHSATSNDNEASALLQGSVPVEDGQADADGAGHSAASNDNEASALLQGVHVEDGLAFADGGGDSRISNNNEASAVSPGRILMSPLSAILEDKPPTARARELGPSQEQLKNELREIRSFDGQWMLDCDVLGLPERFNTLVIMSGSVFDTAGRGDEFDVQLTAGGKKRRWRGHLVTLSRCRKRLTIVNRRGDPVDYRKL